MAAAHCTLTRSVNPHAPCLSARAVRLPLDPRAFPRTLAVQPCWLPQRRQMPTCARLPARQRTGRGSALRSSSNDEQAARAEHVTDDAPAEEQDFDLLSNLIAETTKDLQDELKGCSIYLVGMMGSGKSTLGRMLANTLKYVFFDTDAMIEATHNNMKVSEIFTEYGEGYFRQCEGQVLKELSPYKNLVVATGGGAVTNPVNWSYMHQGVVAWLTADPELLLRRVLADGLAGRPLLVRDLPAEADSSDAVRARLKSLLAEREKFYSSADVHVPLHGYGADVAKGAPTAVVMYRLLRALKQKIAENKRARAAGRRMDGAAAVPRQEHRQ